MKEIETSKRHTRELLGTSFLRSISSLCTRSARAFSVHLEYESIRYDGLKDSRKTRKAAAGSRRTMKSIECEECGGTGIVYWYIGEDLEEEEEECDICKGSGTLNE